MLDAAALDLSSPKLSLRLQQQELVAEFGRFAMETDSFQAILNEVSVVAARGLGTVFAKVLEYIPCDTSFVVRSGVGWHDGVVGHARVGANLRSPAGYAFRTGKPVVSNHLTDEQRFQTPALLAEHNIRSAINVLISARNAEPFGVLEGDSRRRGLFDAHDVAFLQGLANTLAVALEAQKRQDARADLLREKETLLLENHALLRQKDLLMEEVHHRVMNSLHLVQNIMTMQARTFTSAEARGQIEEAAGRIMTIGAVHRRLYQGSSTVSADAGQFLHGLLDDMRGVLPSHAGDRALELEAGSFSLPAADITSLGLITGELITNALKYGQGRIRIEVGQKTSGLHISVSDEGNGFPSDYDPAASRGLGMRLVSSLAKAADSHAVRVDRSVPFGRIVVETAFGGSS